MNHWYQKTLGSGAAVYQHLRDLRELRYQHDRDVSKDRTYIVVTDMHSTAVIVFFPPGYLVLAQRCGAVKCEEPDLDDDRLAVLSTENFPIVTAFAEDTVLRKTGRKANDTQ